MSGPVRIPIQPFDRDLRERLSRVIVVPFEQEFKKYGAEASYNPDLMGEVADRVIAFFVGELLGIQVELAPQSIIGPGTIVLDATRNTSRNTW